MDKNEICIKMAFYMIKEKATIRKVAKKFGIPRATTYKYVTCRLERINPELAIEVKKVLMQNKLERSSRAGITSRNKRRSLKSGK